MNTPTEKIDRVIYHVLTHGPKQRSEVIALMGDVAAEQTIDKHLSYLVEQDYIRRIDGNRREVYYQIEGSVDERQPPQRRPDQEKLDRVMNDIEYRLQIREDNRYPTMTVPTLSHSMGKLHQLAKGHVFILETDARYNRFKSIFQESLSRSVEGERRSSKTETFTPRPFGYFYLAVYEMVLNSKFGKENPDLFRFLHDEVTWIRNNFHRIKKSLQFSIQRLALEVDPHLGQQLIIEIANRDDVGTARITNRILEAYEPTHEINLAIDELIAAKGEKIPAERADKILTEIQKRYTESRRTE